MTTTSWMKSTRSDGCRHKSETGDGRYKTWTQTDTVGFFSATRVAYFPNLASSLSGDPSILDPTQCLEQGSTMIWSIIERVYPVYISNSLLNSNPNFDVAPFLKLQEEMELSSEVPDLKVTDSD